MNMNRRTYYRILLAVFTWLFLSMPLAYADQIENPADLVQASVTDLQNKIAGDQGSLEKNPQQLYQVINTTIMPYVDINQMASLALGPKWREATPAQQADFTKNFGLLLTKNYAAAIVAITNYKISIYPMRGDAWQTEQYVSVNGQITSLTNGQSSKLTYYLERSGNSWEIYDLAIEGVSFLKNYQAQFQSFKDMGTLLVKLNQMNSAG